jgi:hypothetical protein
VTLYVVGINASVLERVGSQYRNYLLTTPPDIINRISALPPVSYKMYMSSKFSNSFLMGGGISDWFKKAHSMGTRAYSLAKDKLGDMRQSIDDVQTVAKHLSDRGTRLFGDNVRPAKKKAYFQ